MQFITEQYGPVSIRSITPRKPAPQAHFLTIKPFFPPEEGADKPLLFRIATYPEHVKLLLSLLCETGKLELKSEAFYVYQPQEPLQGYRVCTFWDKSAYPFAKENCSKWETEQKRLWKITLEQLQAEHKEIPDSLTWLLN